MSSLAGLNSSGNYNAWNWNYTNQVFNNNNMNNNNYVRPVRELAEERDNKSFSVCFDVSYEDVLNAYYDCRKNKRSTLNSLEFEIDYFSKCYDLWEELKFGRYKIGNSICFVVTKPKKREVFAADFRDRIVHHLLIEYLNKYFEQYFDDEAYNCRIGKGTLYGVKRMYDQIKECSENYAKDCWILKFDVQGFFMSIDRSLLHKKLSDFIESNYFEPNKDFIQWATKIIALHDPENHCKRKMDISMWKDLPKNKSLFTCGDGIGLPIGNLPSQIFANFLMTIILKEISKKFKYRGLYVDDGFIISNDKKELLQFINTIKNCMKGIGLKLHPDKIYIQHHTKGCNFIGGVCKNGRVYVNNRTVHNMNQCIKTHKSLDKNVENAEKLIQSMNSYFGYMVNFYSYNIRKKASDEINKFFGDFILASDTKLKLKYMNTIKVVTGDASEYAPTKITQLRNYVVSWDLQEHQDQEQNGVYYSYSTCVFKRKPSDDKIRTTIVESLNNDCKNAIENDCRYNDGENTYGVKLTGEKIAEYDMAVQTAIATQGASLPFVTTLIGQEGEVQYSFDTVAKIVDFYSQYHAHITSCNDLYASKIASIDWSQYTFNN